MPGNHEITIVELSKLEDMRPEQIASLTRCCRGALTLKCCVVDTRERKGKKSQVIIINEILPRRHDGTHKSREYMLQSYITPAQNVRSCT